MLKHEVIELVNQHTRALSICQVFEEVGVVDHFKIPILINTHTSSGNRLVDSLLDTTR